METSNFTTENERVNKILNDPDKVYGGITPVVVGSKFTLPLALSDDTVVVKQSVDTITAQQYAAKTPNAKRNYHKTESGAYERVTDYLAIVCPEGDLALGTLTSAASAVNSTLTPDDVKTEAADSITADCRGRARQVLGWVEGHAGQTLYVTGRHDYDVTTRTAGTLTMTLTVFSDQAAPTAGRRRGNATA